MPAKNKVNYLIYLSLFLIVVGIIWILTKEIKTNKQRIGENPQLLKGLDIAESCFDLLPDQKLVYQFKSSSPVSFNIHYHEQGNPVYLLEEKEKTNKAGVLYPPKKQNFCLMWINPGMEDLQLSYSSEIQFQEADSEYERIPVQFKVTPDQQSILLVDKKIQTQKTLFFNASILNYELNAESTLLAVSTSSQQETVQVYDLKTLRIISQFSLPQAPRFLAFSDDNHYLSTGDEHSKTIHRFHLTKDQHQQLELPLLPLALFVGDRPNELLVRTEREVLKVQLEPIKLLARNARIEFNFGEETFFADPEEVCTLHGIPHPLFTPKETALSPEGLSGYYYQPK